MAKRLSFFENMDLMGEKRFENEPDEVVLKKLYRAIKTLSPEMKQTIILYYIKGFSQPEIAKILGVNQSSVSKRIKRAVVKLRKVIQIIK